MAVDRVLRLVDVGDEVLDPALVVELDPLAAGALVGERDPQAAGEERRLAEALHDVSAENSSSSKISASGRNEIVVPVSVVVPTTFISPCGTPRANSWR